MYPETSCKSYRRIILAILVCILAMPWLAIAQDPPPQKPNAEGLWDAARRGELEKVKQAVESGVDVNSVTNYGASALSFAADRGHLEVVQYLLAKQADPNVKDSFYNATPIVWAGSANRYDIMKALILAGANDVDTTLVKAVAMDDLETIDHITRSGKASRWALNSTLSAAKDKENRDAADMIERSLITFYPKVDIPQATLDSYTGTYLSDTESRLDISQKGKGLSVKIDGGGSYALDADSQTDFSNPTVKLKLQVIDSAVVGLRWTFAGREQSYRKLTDVEIASLPQPAPTTANDRQSGEISREGFPASLPESLASDLAVSSQNWGQFRGTAARGIADGQKAPITWDAEKGENLAWKTPIPGLGHSCPVIWNDRLFVTTAISGKAAEIRIGEYGDVDSVDDDSEHEFITFCLNTQTGEILWQQTACKKTPSVKRHLKSTHANSTIATDGTHVVAWFGTEGVYCYTMDGQLVWEKDLGLLDSGWFYDRDYQWQFGASPIIHNQRLILQCDIQDQSFIAMYDVATGSEIWKTNRDEIPSWSTPTVIDTPTGLQVVTNATGAARGYDFETGKQLWQIKRNSEIAVPTPFTARGLIFISSGYRPIQPIYAIRLDARGDLTLDEGVERSEYVAWSVTKGGPYMPTPIVYGDYLYLCSNSGILTCYQAITGELVYKKRLPTKGNRSFVGSPIAADGNLYLTSEEGETVVIQAGPTLKLVSNNFCGENCLATPAISTGTIYIRGQNHIFAFR